MLMGQRVDPVTGLTIVDQMTRDGIQQRYCGALPTPKDHKMMSLPGIEQVTGISPIPREKWPGLLFEHKRTDVPIMDQNGQGACVAYAATAAVMLTRSRAGSTFQLLSPNWLYTEINGGRDGGANGGDAIQVLTDTGIPLASLVPGRPLRPKGISTAITAAAGRFKLRSSILINSIEEAVTAVLYGWQLVFDVEAGNSYVTSSDGTISYLGSRTNHEQTAGEGLRLASDGTIQILGRNSWNTTWGQAGFGWFTEKHFAASSATFGVQYMIEDPQDPDVIPGLSATP